MVDYKKALCYNPRLEKTDTTVQNDAASYYKSNDTVLFMTRY